LLFFFLAEADSREEGVLLDMCIDLLQDFLGDAGDRLLLVFLRDPDLRGEN